MEQKLVTIVVPIYKVEKYLERCLRSIVNQCYRNLEIILVDDGSPDRCPEMCDEWAQKDARIKVIHKQNAGLGMARNTGIENAAGEYICFFDSDDYVDERLVGKAYERIEREKADIVVYGLTDVREDESFIKHWVPNVVKETFRGKEIQEEFLADLIDCSCKKAKNKRLALSACVCMFSMSMINKFKWRFVSERDIISEDSYSLIELYRYVSCVSVIQEPMYFYRKNTSSLTKVYREDRFDRCKQFYVETLRLAERHEYGDEVKKRIAGLFLSFVISVMKQIIDAMIREKEERIKEIVKDEKVQEAAMFVTSKFDGKGKSILIWGLKRRSVIMIWLLLIVKKRLSAKQMI